MTDLSTFLLPLFASALGGAFVAGGFGIYNSRTAKKDEHEKWLRDQKVEAYQAFLTGQDALTMAVLSAWAGSGAREAVRDAVGMAHNTLALLAPPAVSDAAQALVMHTTKLAGGYMAGELTGKQAEFLTGLNKYQELTTAFARAARKDLDIDPEDYAVSGSQLADLSPASANADSSKV